MRRPALFAVLLFGFVASEWQATADDNPAANAPDRFAWQLFVALNQSARNGTQDATWETWALQDDVYADPNNQPQFPTPAHRPLRLRPSRQLQIFNDRLKALESSGGPHIFFLPQQPLEEEVRMNRSSFDFIVANRLWYVQGQVEAFNKQSVLTFPTDAKEVKAHWKQITEADKARYHWQTGSDGNTYGLIALHIMTKDLPNWFWATWEHVDNPQRCKQIGCRDSFGVMPSGQLSTELVAMMNAAGMGPEWMNYRLTGSQTEFVDATGRPVIIGNSEVEGPFIQTSSCISCHARATVNNNGNRLDIFVSPNPLQGNVGVPDPSWFYQPSNTGEKRKFLQLDFVWSLFLAQARMP